MKLAAVALVAAAIFLAGALGGMGSTRDLGQGAPDVILLAGPPPAATPDTPVASAPDDTSIVSVGRNVLAVPLGGPPTSHPASRTQRPAPTTPSASTANSLPESDATTFAATPGLTAGVLGSPGSASPETITSPTATPTSTPTPTASPIVPLPLPTLPIPLPSLGGLGG